MGDFRFSFVPASGAAAAGDSIRILPDGGAGAPGRALRLVWPLTATDTDPALPAGAVVSLSAQARAFSPPNGVALIIREFDGTTWRSSSVRMDAIQWHDYVVTRAISPDAVEVQFGLEWQPATDTDWVEFRAMQATFGPDTQGADTPADELSPTDTPTSAALAAPTATPTPPSTPTPMATPTPPAVWTALPSAGGQANPAPAAAAEAELIVVTLTPTPVDVFAAATQAVMATDWARILGTATATPPNLVTPTPTPTPFVVTNTPTPANEATAAYVAAYATAAAFTTGTPTPFPAGIAVLVATDTPPPVPPTAAATAGPTPIFVYVDELIFPTSTPTPAYPPELVGKILFLSPYLARNRNQPNAFMVNPDGTGLALLKTREFYDRAKAHDAYSADKRFYAYAQREPLGGLSGLIQIYWNDGEYGSQGHQLTYFGIGTAWAPAFSPVDAETVALVSNESANDEIWLAQRNQWPAVQLTKNEWEWDRSPSFSPDGREIVFESNRVTGTRQLWMMDAERAEPAPDHQLPLRGLGAGVGEICGGLRRSHISVNKLACRRRPSVVERKNIGT